MLDRLVYKSSHSRGILAKVLADKYEDLAATGWELRRGLTFRHQAKKQEREEESRRHGGKVTPAGPMPTEFAGRVIPSAAHSPRPSAFGLPSWRPPILRRRHSLLQDGERISPGFVHGVTMPFQKTEDALPLGLQVERLEHDRPDARLGKIQ